MVDAYIGLGSNIGDAALNVRKAFETFCSSAGVEEAKLSPLYRSAPVGKLDQDWFVNAALHCQTSLPCRQLLELCLSIEAGMKRKRVERWGPRIIDLDLLLYGDDEVVEDGLFVPHPHLHERAFALRPLMDLNATLRVRGNSLGHWLSLISDQELEALD